MRLIMRSWGDCGCGGGEKVREERLRRASRRMARAG